MKDLLQKIKSQLNRQFDKIDFYMALALIISILSVALNRPLLSAIALLPAFVSGFYLAIGDEDDDDGDDDFEWTPEPDQDDYELKA